MQCLWIKAAPTGALESVWGLPPPPAAQHGGTLQPLPSPRDKSGRSGLGARGGTLLQRLGSLSCGEGWGRWRAETSPELAQGSSASSVWVRSGWDFFFLEMQF